MADEQSMITLRRVEDMPGLELISARNITHALPRHMHGALCLVIVDHGARECRYKGSRYVVTPGQVQVVRPGDVHTCSSAGGRYSYRAICLTMGAVAACAAAAFPKLTAEVPCCSPVVDDGELYRLLAAAHEALAGAGGTMARETALHKVFLRLAGYADPSAASLRSGGENQAVKLIQQYLAEHYADDVSISDLALVTGFSPYHLIHVFTAALGLSPHAYLNQVRISRAKQLLAAGGGLAEAALAVGFADQSHFQRWFKKIVGVTPGQYAAML